MKLVAGSTRLALCLLCCIGICSGFAESVRIVTYNLEGYLDRAAGTRPAKSPESKLAVQRMIAETKPDVLAVQEVGGFGALCGLRDSLKTVGVDLPHTEFVAGYDTNIAVGILSRFPFAARRSHTNESFLLRGRRFRCQRGFGEVDIQPTSVYRFTLFAAHLKSRRPSPREDEAELRLQEAMLLREIVDARLQADPKANLIVVGDFNDTRNSRPVRALIGKGKGRLLDARPGEAGSVRGHTLGDNARAITWTHYYETEDSYSRLDYILLSPGMVREQLKQDSYVLSHPDWGVASDHRPVVVAIKPVDN